MTSETRTDSGKDKENVKKKDDKSKEKELPLSKVVLRRLPPTMTADTLLEQLSPVPDYNYFYFCPADKSLGRGAFSRAYINFLNMDDLFVFTEKFDNYVFLDDNGGEFPVMVEYAPYQKIPKKKSKKTDTRKGTLEKDPDYLKFLEAYENPQKPQNSYTPEMILEEIETREKELKANHGVLKVSTPLLDFVKKKREEKKQARDKYRDDRKKRDEDRRKKKDEDRKRKKDRDRERQMEKERERKKERDRQREGDAKGEPLKMLMKNNEKSSRRSASDEQGGEDRKYEDRKYEDRKYKDSRHTHSGGKDSSSRTKEKVAEKDGDRVEREKKRREREDEEERKWRERERDRREKRERERKDREKKERERRDKERKERDRKQKEAQKEQKMGEDQPVRSESSSKIDIRSIIKVDVMKDSTSSLDDQPSGSENQDRSGGDSKAQRSKARYKDRPERQIYNPGQRAAERRKQMEAKKESTPEPQDGGSRGGQGRRGRRDRGEGYDDYRDTSKKD